MNVASASGIQPDTAELTVLGRADSLNVRKTLWGLTELGLPYVRHDFGGAHGGTREASYRALNPTGLIPTLLHDGRAIWESNTILRYLGEVSNAAAFIGRTPQERAVISQWMDWELTLAAASMQPLFHQLVRKALHDRDPELIASKTDEAAESMRLLDAALVRGEYIAGDTITAADCALGVYVHRYYALEILRPKFTMLEAYHRALAARPGFIRHVAIGIP